MGKDKKIKIKETKINRKITLFTREKMIFCWRILAKLDLFSKKIIINCARAISKPKRDRLISTNKYDDNSK